MPYTNPEDFAKLTLKKFSRTVEIDTSEGCRLASLSMASQARRSIEIVSRHLDPPVYDNQEFEDAMTKLVVRSQHARARILVLQPDTVVKQGHRLVNLTQRLTTFMEMRVPAPEHADYLGAFMIVDDVGIVYRPHGDRFEGTAKFDNRVAAMDSKRQFEDMWSSAMPDPNLRRTYL